MSPPAALARHAAALEALPTTPVQLPPGPNYAGLAELAAAATQAPIACLWLLDGDRPCLKATAGLKPDDVPCTAALCSDYPSCETPVVCLDMAVDPCFPASLLSGRLSGLRFCAVVPVLQRDSGCRIGTLCVMDYVPWVEFPDRSVRILELVAQQVAELAHAATQPPPPVYDFLARLGHALQAPLQSIPLMAEALQGKTAPDSLLLLSLDSLVAAAQHHAQGLRDLLHFLALQPAAATPAAPLEAEPFDLRECVEGLFDGLAPDLSRFGAANVGYEMPEDYTVTGDQRRLRQLILPLLQTAVRDPADGAVQLRVSVELCPETPGRGCVRFAVRGGGDSAGIPLGDDVHPFAPVDADVGVCYAGLRLTACRGLCQAMGGRLVTDGAGFAVSLPLPLRPCPPPPAFRDRRVLVLDAEDPAESLLVKHCVSLGLQVSHSRRRSEAVQLLQEAPHGFDVALCTAEALDGPGRLPSGLPWVLVGAKGPRRRPSRPAGDAAPAFSLPTPIMQLELRRRLDSLWEELPSSGSSLGSMSLDVGGLQVCVVDDNRVNRIVMMELLRRLGCTSVDLFSNGQEAVIAASLQNYDVIFMDVEMPVVDGFSATRLIRETNSTVYIAAMTADDTQQMQSRCNAAGMDEVLLRPVRFEAVEQAMQRYCRTALCTGRLASFSALVPSPSSSFSKPSTPTTAEPVPLPVISGAGRLLGAPPPAATRTRRATRFADSDTDSTQSLESVVVFSPHRPSSSLGPNSADRPRRTGGSLRMQCLQGLAGAGPRSPLLPPDPGTPSLRWKPAPPGHA